MLQFNSISYNRSLQYCHNWTIKLYIAAIKYDKVYQSYICYKDALLISLTILIY